MFIDFYLHLKKAGLPVSFNEYLTLLEGLDKGVIDLNVDDFYYLTRSIMVKHESHLDIFDQLFGEYFKGFEASGIKLRPDIPEEWLKKNLERYLTDEEKAKIEAMGGLDRLMDRFKELLEEQKKRHEGGNKWIGTGGTSPFGAHGYNPEGFRIGPDGGGRSAVKVWEKRQFANLKDDLELDTRNLKLALKRLRIFTREGIEDELNLEDTIKGTARNGGYLDIKMVPSKRNRVKVLMFMDVGGSMNDHVETCSRLFSAARHEFKHLEYFYFHNCIYESVWEDNRRREERIPLLDIMHKYNNDYKVIIIGDAAMSPYEVMSSGGSIEHDNKVSGVAWIQKLKDHFDYISWINPNPEYSWDYFQSTKMLRELMGERMYPMTLKGLIQAMKSLRNKKDKYHPVVDSGQ